MMGGGNAVASAVFGNQGQWRRLGFYAVRSGIKLLLDRAGEWGDHFSRWV